MLGGSSMRALVTPEFGSYLGSFARSQSTRLRCCSVRVFPAPFKIITNPIRFAGLCDRARTRGQCGTLDGLRRNCLTKVNSQFSPVPCLSFAQSRTQDFLRFNSPENDLPSSPPGRRSGSITQTKGGLK